VNDSDCKTVYHCPGFGQDRVYFHRNAGGDTAGGLTPPGQTEQGVPYHVPSCWVPVRGSGNSLQAQEHAAAVVGERDSLGSTVLFCVFPLCISLLFLFPLFAVLLNCPYPDPPVFACFFPFSSAPRQGEGRPRGAFVAGRSQIVTTIQIQFF